VIVAVDGHVRAGGMGLVAAADLAVAGPRSTFALTEARIGVAPAIISLTLLPKMSARAAARYYLTGETFDAATAASIGLITMAADDVDAAVASLVTDIGRGSPQGLAASKALTTAAVLDGFDRDAERLGAESARLFVSDEAREGMLAFLQKRPPSWVSGEGPPRPPAAGSSAKQGGWTMTNATAGEMCCAACSPDGNVRPRIRWTTAAKAPKA
jgi:enoyl-CoA hydratase